MALPDTIGLKAGTAKVWANTGGDYAFTPTSLANDAGWQGAKGDLGVNWAQRQIVRLDVAMASAPTDASAVELYWCPSTSATAGTDNSGNLSGTDATVSNPDQIKRQLTFLGPLILSNALGTGVQKQHFSFYPIARYGFPVVVDKAGVAFSATASNQKVVVTPAIDEVIE